MAVLVCGALLLAACQPAAAPIGSTDSASSVVKTLSEPEPTPPVAQTQVISIPTDQATAAQNDQSATAAAPVAEPLATETPSSPVLFYFPDGEIVYGPAALDFDPAAYLKEAGGALGKRQEYLESTGWTPAADIVQRVALENSINPRLLLALLEYQCGCVRGGLTGDLENGNALGVEDYHWKGLYGQLWWAANQLSKGFYGWREGWLDQVVLPNGDPLPLAQTANPGSVAIQVYFSNLWAAHDQSAKMGAETWKALHPNGFGEDGWRAALDPATGFLAVYREMFGDFTLREEQVGPILPGDLQQPELILPFEPGRLWSYTSGPHKAWEKEGSRAALDFAPASERTGCLPTDAWVTAMADGPVVRIGPGMIIQDLDGVTRADGKEQTGWTLLYMHVSNAGLLSPGVYLHQGQRIGQPSCEGGPSTGTHLHIARKYNGMWIAAGGSLPFVLDGWTVQTGEKPYEGRLVKDGQVVIAHPYASFETHITRPERSPAVKPLLTPDAGENGN